jgi:tetratricopeptide (TPR) repeat protein
MEDVMIKKSLRTTKCFFEIKYLFASLLCMLLASCAGSGMHKGQARQTGQDGIVNSGEYDNAGRYIVAALSSGNAELFNSVIHKKGLLDRTFKGMSQNSPVIKKARADIGAALDEAGILMTKNLGENADLTFVRSRSIEGEHRALVRANMDERGLSYLDFVLGKDDSGMIKIIDWHDYAQGQLYSNSLRQALVFMLPQDAVLASELLGTTTIDKKVVGQFSELARLSEEKRYEEWLEKYEALTEELKYSRSVLVTRVLITSATGANNEYRRALRDVIKYIGNDPSLSLMLVDYYFEERNYKAAHKALDRLEEYTGGDAAIGFLRSNVYLAEENYSESMRHAQAAIRQDPSFEDTYWTLLAVSVYSKQYEIAIDTLIRLESHFDYLFEPHEIARLKGYEEFASSSVFTDWKYGLITR